jgi:sugar phosphate isomerase/epimerase
MIHPILVSSAWFGEAEPAGRLRLRGVAGVHARLQAMCKEDVDQARELAERLGVPLVAVEVTGDVNEVQKSIEKVKRFAGLLGGIGVMVEMSLGSTGTYDVPSAPRADTRAGEVLRGVVGVFGEAGVAVSLRHRAGLWMSRVEDSVRVLMRVNRAEYGVVLSMPDWMAVDGTGLSDRLHLALPRLTNVVVDGRGGEGEYPGGKGLLFRIAGMGYTGPVTVVPRVEESGMEALEAVVRGL